MVAIWPSSNQWWINSWPPWCPFHSTNIFWVTTSMVEDGRMWNGSPKPLKRTSQVCTGSGQWLRPYQSSSVMSQTLQYHIKTLSSHLLCWFMLPLKRGTRWNGSYEQHWLLMFHTLVLPLSYQHVFFTISIRHFICIFNQGLCSHKNGSEWPGILIQIL